MKPQTFKKLLLLPELVSGEIYCVVEQDENCPEDGYTAYYEDLSEIPDGSLVYKFVAVSSHTKTSTPAVHKLLKAK